MLSFLQGRVDAGLNTIYVNISLKSADPSRRVGATISCKIQIPLQKNPKFVQARHAHLLDLAPVHARTYTHRHTRHLVTKVQKELLQVDLHVVPQSSGEARVHAHAHTREHEHSTGRRCAWPCTNRDDTVAIYVSSLSADMLHVYVKPFKHGCIKGNFAMHPQDSVIKNPKSLHIVVGCRYMWSVLP